MGSLVRSNIFGRPVPVPVVWAGLKAYVRDIDDLKKLSKDYEPEITQWVFRRLRKGDVFFDVGAHIGRYTMLVAKRVGPLGSVIAIEPEPDNFRLLRANIDLNRLENCITVQRAIADRGGYADLHLMHFSGWHTINQGVKLKTIRVRVSTLDDLFCELKLGRLDWIKADVEGAELRVLKGSSNTLARFHPNLIVECLDDPSGTEVSALLKTLNYHVEKRYWGSTLYILATSPRYRSRRKTKPSPSRELQERFTKRLKESLD